jgi:hypothetical protein
MVLVVSTTSSGRGNSNPPLVHSDAPPGVSAIEDAEPE